ncbi:hypothetical protein ACSBR1_033783 [Camellia fascicularis]
MENGGPDHHHHHVVTVEEVEKMEEEIKQNPTLLNKSAGNESCCIFRVPQSLIQINKKAYQPQIVSIGPFHHGKPNLEMIEQHKRRFLRELLARSPPYSPKLDQYLEAVASIEYRIRMSYSEHITFDSIHLIKMMVLDGLFIIEVIAKVGRVAPSDPDDSIFNMSWMCPYLMRDFLRFENQIPFFVLEILFDLSKDTRKGGGQTLARLALEFFNYLVQRPKEVLDRLDNLEGKHLLDLFRLSFIPSTQQQTNPRRARTRRRGKKIVPLFQLIQSAKKLNLAGIELKTGMADSFLDIRFHNGVLEIPQITIDDFTTSLFLNSVAFEQCYSHCSKHMIAYATLMGCLMNTPSDVDFLCDKKIVENYLGTDDEVAQFFNLLGKDVAFDIENNYLKKVFDNVNGYYRNDVLVQWAGFKHTYFNTPWSFISALAASLLLLLTMIQAFFAVYSYMVPANLSPAAPP